MQKAVNIGLILIGAISVLFSFLLVQNPNPWLNLVLYLSYALVVLTLLLAIGFAIKILATYPKKLKTALMIGVGALILVAISYFISGSSSAPGASKLLTKWVSTGIILFYMLAFLAVAFLVFFGIKKSLNR